MRRYEAVHREGWQAFGAIQALLSREAALKDLTLNELQSLFRRAASPPAPLIPGKSPDEAAASASASALLSEEQRV